MKENKGITLIALILAIVILLILAIVTINSITGEDDLIGYSKNAAGKYQEEQENESGLLQNYLDKIEEITAGAESKEQHNNPGETEEVEPENEENDIPDVLRKYILGEDEEGRNLYIDMENGIFDDVEGFTDDSTIPNASSILEYVMQMNGECIYFKYAADGKYYKVNIDIDTAKTLNLECIYEPGVSENIGRKLTYKGKEYTVISESEGELELVADYISSEKTTIGSKSYSEALTSYNSAITILNNACILSSGLTVGGDVKEIRSIGSSGNKDSDVRNLANPDSTIFSTYAGDAKDEDLFYEEDIMKLYEADTLNIEKEYWLASRVNGIFDNQLLFGVRYIEPWEIYLGDVAVYVVRSNDSDYGVPESVAVRPVVVIDSNAEGISWID